MFIMIGMDFFFQENHDTKVWIFDYLVEVGLRPQNAI